MWLYLILLITSISCDDSSTVKGECEQPRFRSPGTDIVSSFNKFKNDVQKFFKLNFNRFEHRRKVIARAFYKFIDEAFSDENAPASKLESSPKVDIEDKTESAEPIEDLVASHGYKAESHTVVTTDGYMITVHRILPSRVKANVTTNGAVLLHHGILGSSDDWVLLGPNKSLPYILVNANYDVWLTNARGNKYCKEHASKIITDDDFWNFSWHEIGQFDLSAVIDYIRDQNDKDLQLHFVGHSMGCTALLVLLSMYPRYNHVLKTAILLAPLAFMYEVKGPIRLLAEFYHQNTFVSMNVLGIHDFVPLEYLPREFADKFCKGNRMLCANPLLLMANGGQDIANKTLRNKVLSHVPAGGSMKTIVHYVQLVKSGQFQMFDMGKSKNLKVYGSASPSAYRLNDVTLPVAAFTSTDDWLSTIPDIQSLVSNLPNPVLHHVIKRSDFSHTDFVWGEDADVLIYYLILDVFKQANLPPLDKI